jgi:hypothetical protein
MTDKAGLAAGGEDAGDVDVLCGEGEQGDVTGALEGGGEHTLVTGAGAGLAPGLDLAAVGDVATEAGGLFVVDGGDFVDAEGADATALVAAS